MLQTTFSFFFSETVRLDQNQNRLLMKSQASFSEKKKKKKSISKGRMLFF